MVPFCRPYLLSRQHAHETRSDQEFAQAPEPIGEGRCGIASGSGMSLLQVSVSKTLQRFVARRKAYS